jgi:excinuclease ABC subunit C
MNEIIQQKLKVLPQKPGVYLMKNAENTIIYVGKAKNLLKRVSQYFLRPQAGKVQAMVSHITDFEMILTSNEKEALVLEMNLIHEHYPRYNILLKEGSHYPYIALKKGRDPYLKIMRHTKDKHYHYFGPYPSSRSAYRTIALLNKVFPLRKCNVMPKAACLYFHLKQCLAPCIHTIDQAVYDALVKDIEKFLKGDVSSVVKLYQTRLEEAIDRLQFEQAREYKTVLDDIAHVIDPQRMEMADALDRDIFAYAEREGYLSLAIFVFRKGILLGKKSFIVESFGDVEDQLVSLLAQFYRDQPLPQEFIVNVESVRLALIELFDFRIVRVEKGNLYELMALVQENALQNLDDHFLTARLDDDKLSLLENFGVTLQIPTPFHIEMIDHSHLQGEQAVGALVVFINGEPVKKMYRYYHLSKPSQQDDVEAMREVVHRRYSRLLQEQGKLPQLLIVDGGEHQIAAAVNVLKQLNCSIPVAGLFKNEKHQTKGLLTSDGEVITLTDTPALFFFLVRLQDEVHRYAISFHRRLRNKKMTRSILDDIPGLGGKRQAVLASRYPSLDALKQASLTELNQLLPKEVAQRVFDKLTILKPH